MSRDGNFVLNFGPKADGSFRPEEIKNAKEIGEWFKVNSPAIYNCEYAGWEKQDWGYYTKKTGENKVYMIVFNVPVSGRLKIKPANKLEVDKAYFLSAPQTPFTLKKLDYGASFLHLPEGFAPGQPFVIVLEIKIGKQKKEEENKHT